MPSHCDTIREPASDNQITGIHSAIDERAVLSRSRKNSPRIPMTQRTVATIGGVTISPNESVSLPIEELAVQELHGQHPVNLPGVVSVASGVAADDILDRFSLKVRP